MEGLPIDMDLIQKKIEIPTLLADLSKQDSDQALYLLREWGDRKLPITVLHHEITSRLKTLQAV